MAWKTIGVKVQDEFKSEVDRIASENGKTTSDFVRICVEDAVHGHYKLEGDHLVPTEEYLNALRPIDMSVPFDDDLDGAVPFDNADGWEYREFGYVTITRLLRKKDYPDEYIKKMVENMISTAYDMPKYNPRRSRSDDGC